MQLRRRCRRAVAGTLVVLAAGSLGAPTVPAPAQARTPPACPVATACRLTAGLPEARALDVEVTPDGTRAVFLHTSDGAGQELYGVRLGGAGRVKLSVPLPTGWDVSGGGTLGGLDFGWQLLPDGSRAVYEVQSAAGVSRQLLSVPTAGPTGASVRLDSPPTGSIEFGYRVAADSSRVVYAEGTTSGDVLHLGKSVPAAGTAGAGAIVTWPTPTGELFTISPDGDHVVWELGDTGVLFRTASTGPIGDSVRLNGDEDPNLPQIDPASRRVTYLADQPGPQRDLFSAPIGGNGTRYNLTAALDAAFIPSSYRLTPTHAVYPATPDFDGFHLYSSRLVPT